MHAHICHAASATCTQLNKAAVRRDDRASRPLHARRRLGPRPSVQRRAAERPWQCRAFSRARWAPPL
eukprot:3383540-Pyramimonas_sp.AAC.1